MSEELLDFNAERVDRQMADLLEYPANQLTPKTLPLPPSQGRHQGSGPGGAFNGVRAGDTTARQQVTEVLARNRFANELINDKTGKLAMMTGDDPRNPVDLGPDIKAKAQALLQV
ncbi:hypothetical protein DTO217A2_5606 [Paecilomyces variotii]|nr:hypothetical protein DTO217A2_5606 [Paecilomyces variotii]KAJ9352272.1 hypothetical protein DTO027B9_5973 [Paecilomyces variotii]